MLLIMMHTWAMLLDAVHTGNVAHYDAHMGNVARCCAHGKCCSLSAPHMNNVANVVHTGNAA